MAERGWNAGLAGVLGAWAAGVLAVLGVAGQGAPVATAVAAAGVGAAVAAEILSARRARGWVTWDRLAGLLVAGTGLALLAAGAAATERLPETAAPALVVATSATLLIVAGAAARLARREQIPPRALPAALAAGWRDADGEWRWIAAGALLAAPLALAHNRVLADADSARLLAIVRHVREVSPRYLVETQEVLLPHLLLGPAVDAWGIGGALAVTIAALMLLCGLLTLLAWRLSGSLLGALAAVPAFWASLLTWHAVRLPMYPTALLLGYGGAWLAHRAFQRDGSLGREIAGAVALVAAIEAHAIAQLFLGAPALVWAAVHRRRAALPSLARMMLFTGLALLPRLAINLAEWDGSLRLLRSGRTDWFNAQGYLTRIAVELRDQPLDGSVGAYLAAVGEAIVGDFQPANWLLVGLAVLGLVLARRNARLLAVGGIALFAFALLTARPGVFVRYLAPLLPGLVIAAAAGIGLLARRGRFAQVTAVALLIGLSVGAVTQFDRTVTSADRSVARAEATPIPEVVELIGPGAGVIGVRAASLHYLTADVDVYGGLFLTEDEYLTYLTWPSDEDVLALLDEHGIDWVLVHADRYYEVEYHSSWVEPVHGLQIRHPQMLAGSPNFCRVDRWRGHTLYRVGECPPQLADG